jgi:hypothetical protein
MSHSFVFSQTCCFYSQYDGISHQKSSLAITSVASSPPCLKISNPLFISLESPLLVERLEIHLYFSFSRINVPWQHSSHFTFYLVLVFEFFRRVRCVSIGNFFKHCLHWVIYVVGAILWQLWHNLSPLHINNLRGIFHFKNFLFPFQIAKFKSEKGCSSGEPVIQVKIYRKRFFNYLPNDLFFCLLVILLHRCSSKKVLHLIFL